MADTPGQNMTPETGTQDTTMPIVNQQTPEGTGQVTGGMDVPPISQEQTVTQGLPDTVSERTRSEFEKLRYQLVEERSQRARIEEIIKALTAPQVQPSQPPVQPQVTPIYDPQTGLLNEDVLTDTRKEALDAKRIAEEVKAEAAQIRQEALQIRQEAEAKETYSVYPELDPYARHGKPLDKQLEIATRRILIDSQLNPQDYGLNPNQRGRGLSFLEAARLAHSTSPQKVEEVKQQAATEAIEGIAPKEQASLEASSVAQADEPVDEERLVSATRKGNIDALASRISRMRKQKS